MKEYRVISCCSVTGIAQSPYEAKRQRIADLLLAGVALRSTSKAFEVYLGTAYTVKGAWIRNRIKHFLTILKLTASTNSATSRRKLARDMKVSQWIMRMIMVMGGTQDGALAYTATKFVILQCQFCRLLAWKFLAIV